MVDFKSRRHRLEIPAMPNSDDPAVLKRALDQMKRLVQDEFNRLSTDFYDFKKATYDAAILPLRGVANIQVLRTQYGMTATWELPDGQDVTPTQVRVRILEISPNSWATYSYPKTSWEFNGLTPGTQYTLQVQLIAVFEATDSFVSTTRNCPSLPVLRTAESDIRAKVFTTQPGVTPPSNTAFNDDRVIFNFPTTVGAPGAPASALCWWEYKFQYRTACAWADTGAGGAEVAGNIGNVTIDTGNVPFSTYPNTVFRLAYREICNAVPQVWVYGEPFMAVNFANADCRGIVKSASLTTAPFSTATLFALPGACQSDDTFLQITNELADTVFSPNEPGFKCMEYIDNEWTLIADDTANTAISNTIFTGLLSGTVANIANFNAETDFTLAFDIKVANNALVLAGGTGAYTIIDIGGKIKVQMIQNTASYSLQIVVPRDGGGAYVFRADALPYASWVTFYYVHDVSEANGRALYANGVEVARSANAIANDFTGITGDVQINTVNNMQIRSVYAWNIAVLEGDILGAAVIGVGRDSDTVLINSCAIPAHTNGDIGILIQSIVVGGASMPALPAGWTSLGTCDPGPNQSQSRISYKVLNGVESSVTIQTGSLQTTSAVCVVVANAGTPVIGGTGGRSGGGTTWSALAGGLASARGVDIIFAYAGNNTIATFGNPTGASLQATYRSDAGSTESTTVWSRPIAGTYAGETGIAISGSTSSGYTTATISVPPA